MNKIGVIVGRFYPFHRGHRFLIETALKNCEQLYVIVTGRYGQTIDYDQRAEWIKTSFKAEVTSGELIVKTFHQDAAGLPDRDTNAWADAVKTTLGFCPDIVFTSEPYQDGLAKVLGAEFFVVDSRRAQVPISATRIRENPERWADMLEPHVLQDVKDKVLADDGANRFSAVPI